MHFFYSDARVSATGWTPKTNFAGITGTGETQCL
jgi:hypothetical protein